MSGATLASDVGIADAFLGHHLALHPVDATFMGIRGYDRMLPRADAGVAAEELRSITALRTRLARVTIDTNAARIDARMIAGELDVAEATLDARPRWHNPAWFTGEAAFGLISLLLPQATPYDPEAIATRLEAIPDFLADGRARLRERGRVPVGWCERARREARASASFLASGLPLHGTWRTDWREPAWAAAEAFEAFASSLDELDPCDAAAGAAHLDLVMRAQHGLDASPVALAAAAEADFERLTLELEEDARAFRPGQEWQHITAGLAERFPAHPDDVVSRYRHWHEEAQQQAASLVTPALEYGLDYRPLSSPFQQVAAEMYFLFYRSPPPAAAGTGSVYWVMPAAGDAQAYLRSQNESLVKLVHAVHHGSIGHHTHNARARTAGSVLARVAGTDCALGIAFLSGGMAVEGWACHAEDLMAEVPGFYDPAELLLLKQYERRNAASVLVDVRLHLGIWSEAEAERFYRDEAGYPPQRARAEVVRNTMFPGSRLMYWAGVEAIRALRRRWRGDTRSFHDTLLQFGHVPMAAIEEAMAGDGLLK